MASSVDEHQLLLDLCRNATIAGRHRLAWYGRLAHDGSHRIAPVAAAGDAVEYVDGLRVTWDATPYGQGPGGQAARTGRVVTIDDTTINLDADSPQFEPWRARAAQFGLRSNTSIPVWVHGRVDGVLCIYSDSVGVFDDMADSIHLALCQQVGVGLERLQAAKRTSDALHDTVRVLTATLEARDPYTSGHQSAVSVLSERIARHLGFQPFEAEGVAVAGLLHDIGKVGVPIELLLRPTALRQAERQLIEAHTTIGEEVLSSIRFPWPIAQIVGQHHERLDGSGYPRGLGADDIRTESRIVMVADVFDAMLADRPYRRGHSLDVVLGYLRSNAGTLFDSDVVQALAVITISDREGVNG
jgi:putative nucleotidyltransferase with HDIG domain